MFFLESTSKESLNSLDYSGSSYSSYSGSSGFLNPFGNIQPGVLLAIVVIALIISILVFIFLVQKKKAPRGRFLRWLREYLNFRSILVAGIIKFVYIFLAVILTIASFFIMFQGKDDSVLTMIVAGLVTLIVGNILLRVMLELTMALIVVWENTSDIRSVIVKKDEMPEEKKPKAPKEPKDELKLPEVPKAEQKEPIVIANEPVAPSEPAPEQPSPIQPAPEQPTPIQPVPEQPQTPQPGA